MSLAIGGHCLGCRAATVSLAVDMHCTAPVHAQGVKKAPSGAWAHIAPAHAMPSGHWLFVTRLAIGHCLGFRVLPLCIWPYACTATHLRVLTVHERHAAWVHLATTRNRLCSMRLAIGIRRHCSCWGACYPPPCLPTCALCLLPLIESGRHKWRYVNVTGRLEDKSSLVRKAALQLLGELLASNPFGPRLPEADFAASYAQYRARLQASCP